MMTARVMIVEDDAIIALDVEQVLCAAGFDVCGVASSEGDAILMAGALRPEMAIVDISLSPGDGRNVARALYKAGGTAVLFASGQCDEVKGLRDTGALACLSKPYDVALVPEALRAVFRLSEGDRETPLPYPMVALPA